MAPAVTGSGAALLAMERSALPTPTVVVAVADSLPGLGSAVVDASVAVLLSTVPGVTLASTATTSVNTALPDASAAAVQDTVPAAPTTGVVQDQPPGEASETKVVLAGSGSDRLTPRALLGPALFAEMV